VWFANIKATGHPHNVYTTGPTSERVSLASLLGRVTTLSSWRGTTETATGAMVDDDKQRWLVRDVSALIMVIDSETTTTTDLWRISVDTKRGNRDMALAESAVPLWTISDTADVGLPRGKKARASEPQCERRTTILDNR